MEQRLDPKRAAALVSQVCVKADEVWASSGSVATGGDENLLILQTHHHIREQLEAVAVLLADGLVESCKVHLRVAFEALLTLEYVTEADAIRRAYAWLVVVDILDRIKVWDRLDATTVEGKKFVELSSKEGHGFPEFSYAGQNRHRLQHMLETDPRWVGAYNEYSRLAQSKKARRRRVEWYELFGGPAGPGFKGLAYHLGHGVHYEIIYRLWSRRIHGTDVVQRVRSGPDGIVTPSMRNAGDVVMVLNFAVSFGLMSSRRLITHYCPEAWLEFAKWYVEEFKPGWPLVAGKLPID